MASQYTAEEETDIFVKVEKQIEECFCSLERKLAIRKKELLAEVQRMKSDFVENLKTQDKTLKDLENIRKQLHGINLTQNMKSNLLQSSLAPFEKQISDLKVSLLQPPNLSFSCSTQILSDTISKLGSIVSESSPTDYSRKEKAINIISAEESVTDLHIDCDRLYVACATKVLIFSTTNWEKVGEFQVPKDRELYFYTILAITTKDNFIYCITKYNFGFSNTNEFKILQFTKNGYNLKNTIKKTGGSSNTLDEANSLAISTQDELFVADSKNNRICVFDASLFYRRQFGTNVLKNPKLIKIRRGHDLIVQDNNRRHLNVFNQLGDHLGYLADYGELNWPLNYFCYDNANNLIQTDGKCVIIISPKGEFVKKIGQESGEDVSGCGPVVMYGGQLIVACNSIHCIKIF